MQAAPQNILIIGGGITGLASAHAIQQAAQTTGAPLTFTLLEASPRLGGKIRTELVEGFTVEAGPDCFIRQKPWAAQLCTELGLGADLIGTNDDRRKTFVVNRNRLVPLPDGVMLIVPTRIAPFLTTRLISWPGKLRMGLDLVLPRGRMENDESIGDFVRRRLGREALEKIAEPLLSGIHVSDPEQQSLLATFPRFRDLEKKHRSLVIGMVAGRRASNHRGSPSSHSSNSSGPNSLFISLKGGLGQMVGALSQALTGGQVVTGAEVVSLEKTPNGYRARTRRGETYQGAGVILATPAYVSAALLGDLSPVVSSLLKGIGYVSTATVSLGFRREQVAHPLNGFGYVTPRKERREVSACTWTSIKFDYRAPQGGALLRCFVGGPGKEALVDLSDQALTTLARQELAEMMGVQAEPLFTRVYRWYKANPQYAVGHLERVHQIRQRLESLPALELAGSAYDGVGVPDCTRQGQAAARGVLAQLGYPPPYK